ncbi:uncharacterized protein SCHCODRAFT_02573083 [Schizophyllum commune H4-8]|nr:uncharacterized protein SCHCODRAFT_02573083 [Schizophyllum commune H4-8]KAI5895460.1 hypothetical protein SCHCODRAFT_02573083 [Schizophyllum commune H4-8]
MHQALLIDEILRDIFEECSRGTLNAAARTCRAWTDPALDQLWRVTRGLDAFLSLLPQVKLEGKHRVLTRQPTETEVARAATYARRIRKLVMLQPFVKIPALYNVADGLFLDIRELRLAAFADKDAANLFINPALRMLELDTSRGTELQDLLALLPARCPALDNLRIRGPITEDCDGALRSLSGLRTLSLKVGASLRPAIVASLSRLPRLESLELLAEHLDADALPVPASTLFPALHDLHLRAHAQVAIAFLNLVPRDALRSLRVDLEDTSLSAQTARTVFASVASAASNSLTNFTLEWHRDGEGELTADALAPLARLQRLRRLVLDTRALPDLTDAELDKLAQCWPYLEVLELGSAPLPERDGRADWACRGTLGSLNILANACPRLRALMMPVDLGKGVEGKEEEAVSHASLECLSLWSPSVFEPKEVAEKLEAMFPALKIVDGSPEHENLWIEVHKTMGLPCAQTIMDVCM